jgi:hypothetical protein
MTKQRQLGYASISGILATVALVLGCNSTPKPTPTPIPAATTTAQSYPPRPTDTPPPFKLFHQIKDSITLVTDEHATDEQIEAIVWQLRDAAKAHTFNKLHIPQKAVDARDPIMFFHIYRGSKCAAEKYAAGDPPCGGSYHAAGDYTLGSFKNPYRDDGVLLHDELHQTELWNPDAPTNPPAN